MPQSRTCRTARFSLKIYFFSFYEASSLRSLCFLAFSKQANETLSKVNSISTHARMRFREPKLFQVRHAAKPNMSNSRVRSLCFFAFSKQSNETLSKVNSISTHARIRFREPKLFQVRHAAKPKMSNSKGSENQNYFRFDMPKSRTCRTARLSIGCESEQNVLVLGI